MRPWPQGRGWAAGVRAEAQALAPRRRFLARLLSRGLQGRPLPWTPWRRAFIEERAPKARDPANPISKLRQSRAGPNLRSCAELTLRSGGAPKTTPPRRKMEGQATMVDMPALPTLNAARIARCSRSACLR